MNGQCCNFQLFTSNLSLITPNLRLSEGQLQEAQEKTMRGTLTLRQHEKTNVTKSWNVGTPMSTNVDVATWMAAFIEGGVKILGPP